MLRLIGILTGSAIAVGFLIVALGVPQFASPETEAIPAELPVTESPPEAVDATTTEPEPEVVVADAAASEPETAPIEEMSEAETEALVDALFAPPEAVDIRPVAVEPAAEPGAEPSADEHWYAFWSPFRSEIAANGFVSKLQEKTGIDYRVVKVKTGVYEVAFAYVDEADIQDKLTLISTATGLDVTGG